MEGVPIPPGMRALVVTVDAGGAVVGDHVDLLGQTEKGRALVLLKDAELAGVQQFDEHVYAVTFLVSPEDGERVRVATVTEFKLRARK